MGTSNFDSNVKGKDGDETIAAFGSISAAAMTATLFTGPVTGAITGNVTGNVTGNLSLPTSTNYIKLGTGSEAMGIFFGTLSTADSIEAAATAVIASPGGSLYFSNSATPALWYFTDDDTASNLFSFT